jgi:protein involved in polysaccharide export with SLBB domain
MRKHPLSIVVSVVIFGHALCVVGQSSNQTASNEFNGKEAAERTSPAKTVKGSLSPWAGEEAKKLYKMGVKYGRAKLFRQAAESFQKAVELKPDFADAYYGLGHAYFDLQRWKDAIHALERTLELNPKDADAYSMLGEAYMFLRRESNGAPEIESRGKNGAAGEPVSLTSSNPKVTKSAEPVTAKSEEDLTRIYRVGIADVLDIRLGSTSAQSTLFTVTPTGLLEHPNLAGPLPVEGLTVEEISSAIESELKRRALNDKPSVSVGVREYFSHTILVSGLVKDPGTKILRREAIPLYVVIADAQPLAEAGRATLVRHDSNEIIEIDLSEARQMNRLVRPGDVITLHPHTTQYVYVGGEVKTPGEKVYRRGLTLTQAILAAGGLVRDVKEVQLARANGEGFLSVTRIKLKELHSGKVQDPLLQPGDRITVKN